MGTSFGHVFSKACQYVVDDEKVCRRLKCVSIKSTQTNFLKCSTWKTNFGEGQHEWNKACIEFGLRLRKLNTPMKTKLVLFSNIIFLFLIMEFPMKMFYLYLICSCTFATRIILFQKILQFKATIVLFNSCQTIVKIIIHVSPPLTWDVSQIIVDILFLIVSACVLRQSCKH